MKKFMGNLYVMIASLVIAVFTTVSLITMFVHPVFYVGDYENWNESTSTIGEETTTTRFEQHINFNKNNTLTNTTIITINGETEETTEKQWYYRDGKIVVIVGDCDEMTKEEYKEAVKEIKALEDYDMYLQKRGAELDFEDLKAGEMTLCNNAWIPTMSVMTFVDFLVVMFAVISLLCFISNKKDQKAEKLGKESPNFIKKLFGNLYVMIASLACLVFASVSLICVLVQPLFYAGDYYGKREYTSGTGDDIVNEQWLNFNADNTMTMKQVLTNLTTGETKETESSSWYYSDGDYLFQIGEVDEMTKEEYKEAIKEIKDMTEEEYNAYRDEFGYEIQFQSFYLSNASSMRQESYYEYTVDIYRNKGKMPTVISLAIVDTVLLTIAATSVICFILNKKAKKEEPAPAETPAEEPAETPAE